MYDRIIQAREESKCPPRGPEINDDDADSLASALVSAFSDPDLRADGDIDPLPL